MTSPNSSHLYSVHRYKMTAAESLGSHQLNSFAAFLEEKLPSSSENSIIQIPQLKNMADGKKPQKGGKRPKVMTAFEIPKDIYADYCTPDEAKFGKENKNQRKCAYIGLKGDGQENGGSTDM